MYMLPFLGFLMQGAVLWFIIVYVTQQHDLPWRTVLLWLVLTVLAGIAGVLAARYLFEAGYGVQLVTAMALQVGTLYGILRWEQISHRQTLIVIATFLGFRLLFALPRLLR